MSRRPKDLLKHLAAVVAKKNAEIERLEADCAALRTRVQDVTRVCEKCDESHGCSGGARNIVKQLQRIRSDISLTRCGANLMAVVEAAEEWHLAEEEEGERPAPSTPGTRFIKAKARLREKVRAWQTMARGGRG
jgi:hypothetical protein